MASRFGEVEVTITSAKDLKNVNWRQGPLRPYVVVWVDPARKFTTRVDEEGDQFPQWEQTLTVPLNAPPTDSTLYIDVVHANAAEDTKPLIGSARLPIRDVLDDPRSTRKLDLRRPSGRPHGKISVQATVVGSRYGEPDPYRSQPYGVRGYAATPPPPAAYASPYAAAPPPPAAYASRYAAAPPPPVSDVYGYGSGPTPAYGAAPSSGYPYGGSGQAGYGYGQGGYGYGQGGYGYGQGSVAASAPVVEQKKSKFGMGTGLAVGAVAGVLGGLALSEGVDALENHIAEEAADKVEEQDYYDGDDGGGW